MIHQIWLKNLPKFLTNSNLAIKSESHKSENYDDQKETLFMNWGIKFEE